VLTQEDIQKQQASSLQELLQARAGFHIVNNGGAGKKTSLFLRGTNSDHVLVMIDGIKINTATDGAAPLSILPLELIERIEIVRGPRTSLYGSDAIGGVIQIFTKKGKAGESAKPFISIKAGSHNTKGVSAGISGGINKGWYNLNLKREKTDGYNSCTGSSTAFAGCFTEELDKDSYDNSSASFSAGYQLTDTTKVSAQFLQTDNEIEFDGAPPFAPNEADTLSQIYGLNITSELSDKVDISFSAGHNDHKNENFQSGSFFSRFDTKRDTYSLQSNMSVTDNDLFTVGFDYQNDKVDSTSYAVPSRDNKGLFVEYQGVIANHNIAVGLRNDDNEQFGNHATGNVAVNHAFNGQLGLTASYGTAFKAPTFDQLYFPFFGSSDLRPEKSNTAEIGLRGKHSWGNWSSNLYRTEADDLIIFDSSISLANNVANATIKGFEAIVNTRVQGWDLGADLTLLRTEDKSNGRNQGNKLARRPDKSLRLNLDKDFGKFSIGSSVIAEGSRFDDAGNNRRVGGYTVADLRMGYKLTEDLSLQAKVGNVLDKSYETSSFYPQDGRNYMLTLSYTPK
ncbi:MAG: TonB-dependent receptor, partial [Thiotrichaceae bacterium]